MVLKSDTISLANTPKMVHIHWLVDTQGVVDSRSLINITSPVYWDRHGMIWPSLEGVMRPV